MKLQDRPVQDRPIYVDTIRAIAFAFAPSCLVSLVWPVLFQFPLKLFIEIVVLAPALVYAPVYLLFALMTRQLAHASKLPARVWFIELLLISGPLWVWQSAVGAAYAMLDGDDLPRGLGQGEGVVLFFALSASVALGAVALGIQAFHDLAPGRAVERAATLAISAWKSLLVPTVLFMALLATLFGLLSTIVVLILGTVILLLVLAAQSNRPPS